MINLVGRSFSSQFPGLPVAVVFQMRFGPDPGLSVAVVFQKRFGPDPGLNEDCKDLDI